MLVTSACRGKTFSSQYPVHLRVGVQAAVGQHGELVVQVSRLAQGGQHHAAGGDAGQYQVPDALGAQHDIQVAAGEGGHPALGHDHVAGRRGDGRMHLAGRVTLGEPAGPGDRGEALVPRADLGIPGAEADHHVADRDSGLPGGLDRGTQPGQVAASPPNRSTMPSCTSMISSAVDVMLVHSLSHAALSHGAAGRIYRHRSVMATPSPASIRRSSGRDSPITLPGSPSMPSTNGAPRPSMLNAPAIASGSPVAT